MESVKRSIGRLGLLIMLTGLLSGCSEVQQLPVSTAVVGPSESLSIEGDLKQWVDVADLWSEQSMTEVTAYEATVSAVMIKDLLAAAGPIFEENDLYLIADDGFMVKLDDSTIAGTQIAYFEVFGWCYISEQHPVNSRIKGLRRIVVVGTHVEGTDLNDRGLGFNLIKNGKDQWYSRGELLMMNDVILNRTDGESVLENISIEVMKQHRCLDLSPLLEEEDQLLLMTADGNHHYIQRPYGYLEVSEDFLTHYSEDGQQRHSQVVGALVNPPSVSNMDNYYDAEHYLKKGVPVMTIFLDGFSYEQYLRMKKGLPEAYLSSIKSVSEALTVYKPVTNAGFTAMITGQLPLVSGIHDRSNREPAVATIFDVAEGLDLSHGLIEGDIGILKLNTETLLHLDTNEDGLTDDEIFAAALGEVTKAYDYLMVHFHSIDDRGHDYGPYGAETMAQIEAVDGYVEALVNQWQGIVIITADHGMHKDGEGGDHGLVVSEDIRVPYMVIDQR